MFCCSSLALFVNNLHGGCNHDNSGCQVTVLLEHLVKSGLDVTDITSSTGYLLSQCLSFLLDTLHLVEI